MAIDPSISLGYRPPQLQPLEIQTPLERFGKVLTLRHLMRQGQLTDLQLMQKQKEIEQIEAMSRDPLFNPPAAATGVTAPDTTFGITPPPTMLVPPQQPQDQTASPLIGYNPMTGTVPAPPAAAPPAPAPVVAPATPATVTPAGTEPTSLLETGPQLSAGDYNELWRKYPYAAGTLLKNRIEFQKQTIENRSKQIENNLKNAGRAGSLFNSILKSQDPAAAFIPTIMEGIGEGTFNPKAGRDLIDQFRRTGYNAELVKRLANSSVDMKTQHEIDKTDAETLGLDMKNASASIDSVNDQAGFDAWLADKSPAIRAMAGKIWSPQAKTLIQGWALPTKERFATNLQNAGIRLAGAIAAGPDSDEFKTALAKETPEVQAVFKNAKTPDEVRMWSLDPDKALTMVHTLNQQRNTEENQLRNDFVRDSKEFQVVRDAYGRVQAALAGPKGGIQDIGLIYGYMKQVDPGSIVREGQAASVENAAGVPDWVRNLYNRLLSGEKLPDKVRDDIIAHTGKLYAEAESNQQKLETDYRDKAKRKDVNGDNVIVNYRTIATPKGEREEKPTYPTIELSKPGEAPPAVPPGTAPTFARSPGGAAMAAPAGSTAATYTPKGGKPTPVWIGSDGKYYELPPEPVIRMNKPKTTAPPIGTVEDGHKYIGGDPWKPSSWQEVKQ